MSTETTPRSRPHSASGHKLSPAWLALGLFLLIVALYAIVRVGGRGEVLGSVTILDVQLGGKTAEDAALAIGDLEVRLGEMPAPVLVEGSAAQIVPAQTGFALDTDDLVEEAMAVGRSPNPLSNFFWWITSFARTTEIEPTGRLDATALDATLLPLDEELVGSPPFEGSLAVVDGQLVAEYPRPGRQIDREAAEPALLELFLSLERDAPPLAVASRQPTLTEADIDAARAEAELMLSAPVTLTAESDTSLTFSVDDLKRSFVATLEEDPTRLELAFDVELVDARLTEVRQDFEAAPVNARFEISGYEVVIRDGRNGTKLDAEETAAILRDASVSSSRQAELPLREGAEPDVTTAALEALNIRHLVSQFTTYHDCCQGRVTNIHLIADMVDGVIVRPGETFSINGHVGPRTAEKGFVEAGTIMDGEIIDAVGGGVSQFATTFYNAVFWGGYEDVEHKPHSFYFDRYPEGIESTISWTSPDVVFRNNTNSGVLIKTEYSDTAITVKFYGFNDGRILAGSQSGGRLSMGVVAEGGAAAKKVKGDRSERYDFTDPPSTLYRANPELGVEAQRVVQRASQGWSLRVTRTITVGDQSTSQEWFVRYVAKQEIIEVHPCKVPGQESTCPTTTTRPPDTTVPPPTTVTTAPPATVPPTVPPDTTPTTEP